MVRKVFIKTNDVDDSIKLERKVKKALEKTGFCVAEKYTSDVELIFCIGGDGTFLNLIQELSFPRCPVIGVNTGHLGFFQEIEPSQVESFIKAYEAGNYKQQRMSCVDIDITSKGRKYRETGLNEVVIRGTIGCNIHLNISIGDSFIEKFSGDGILVSSPAGSTAYNYSLGGSIVDPRLDCLQITPIAPINTVAYRSFTSSLIVPTGSTIGFEPEMEHDPDVHIEFDGFSVEYEDVSLMRVKQSRKKITLLRLEDYDFWGKVKSKFL